MFLLLGPASCTDEARDAAVDRDGSRVPPPSSSDVADDGRIEVGRKLLKAGRYPEAAVLFETVVAQRPDLARANFYKGLILQNQKAHSSALGWYEVARDLGQEFPERDLLPYYMAWCAYYSGRPRDARLEIDRFLGRTTDSPRADAHFLKGLIHFDADELEEAQLSFASAIEIAEASSDPEQVRDMTRAWVRQADVLMRLGRNRQALGSIDRAVQLAPDLQEAWFRKYTIHSRLGEDAAADEARARWQELRSELLDATSGGSR